MKTKDTKPNNKKSNITLSIDNEILDEIKKDAEFQNISVNAKVNAVLTKHVSFYRIIEDLECSVIPSKIWAQMLQLMDEKKLLDILNNEGMGAIYSIFLNNNVPMTLDNFIKYCCQEICLWSGMYSSFRVFKENGKSVLIFEHKYDIKWSRLLSSAFTNLVRIMLNHKAESQVLPNTVRITVQEK